MDTGTLLRTALVALSLFGLPLLALARAWRREGTPPAADESASGRSRGLGRWRAPRGAYDPISRWE